jgi:hypothetical protein
MWPQGLVYPPTTLLGANQQGWRRAHAHNKCQDLPAWQPTQPSHTLSNVLLPSSALVGRGADGAVAMA